MTLYGIDVSHHNAGLPWATIAEQSKFCIARGSYGTMRDRQTVEHVKHARGAGLKVGSYHFFRVSQPVRAQLDTFLAQLDLAKIGSGDIVPVLDVELDPFPKATPVTPAWQDGIRQIMSELRDRYTNAMVYMTQREFQMLGAPEWLLTFPLWVAHYTGAAKPATPGNRPFTIWQHRVGHYLPFGPGGYDKADPELDQNVAVDLPLIGAVAHQLVAQPAETHEDDTGLEERIAEHNTALLGGFIREAFVQVQADLNKGSGSALREYEEAGLVDDDNGGGPTNNT